MKTANHNHTPNLDAVLPRNADAAPSSLITPTMRIRAQARKEQIMLTSREPAPVTPPPNRARHWGWAAIPAAAAIALGASVALPNSAPNGTLNTSNTASKSGRHAAPPLADDTTDHWPASPNPTATATAVTANFASWSTTPQTLPTDRLAQVADLCWSQLEQRRTHDQAQPRIAARDLWNRPVEVPSFWDILPADYLSTFELLGTEARGDWSMAFWVSTVPNNSFQCITYSDPETGSLSTVSWILSTNSGGAQGGDLTDQVMDARMMPGNTNIIGPTEVMLGVERGIPLPDGTTFNTALGRVGRDVTGVTIQTIDGQKVEATLVGDNFFALWPGEIMPEQPVLGCLSPFDVWRDSPEMLERFGNPADYWSLDNKDAPLLEVLASDLFDFDPNWTRNETGVWVCESEHTPAEVALTERRPSAIEAMTATVPDGSNPVWGVADLGHTLGAVPYVPWTQPTGDPIPWLTTNDILTESPTEGSTSRGCIGPAAAISADPECMVSVHN